MTREEIEKLNELEPYCFETDKEEQWYKVGLKEGLETADNNPKWISVDDSLPCDFENLLENEILTVKVLVVLQRNGDHTCKHIAICDMCYKIGAFTFDGKQLEVIEGYCEDCYFLGTLCFADSVLDIRGECYSEDRKDNEEVCFIKLKEE